MRVSIDQSCVMEERGIRVLCMVEKRDTGV